MDKPEQPTCDVPLCELGQRLSALRLSQPDSDEQVRRSLARHGQLTAVAAFMDGERWQLVDGFKRLRACQQLGWASLRVQPLVADAVTATAFIGALHEQRGLTELEEGWIVRALCRDHGLNQGEVARLLRRHKSWVSRRLLLAEGLDQGVQGDVRLGLLSPRSALAVAALPRGNQRRAAEVVIQRGLTTRQAETLVQRLRELDSDEARAAFMDQLPDVALSTEPKARPRSEHEQLLSDVAILMRVGVRLSVRLLEVRVDTRTDVIREALVNLSGQLSALNRAVRGALCLQEKEDAPLAQP